MQTTRVSYTEYELSPGYCKELPQPVSCTRPFGVHGRNGTELHDAHKLSLMHVLCAQQEKQNSSSMYGGHMGANRVRRILPCGF